MLLAYVVLEVHAVAFLLTAAHVILNPAYCALRSDSNVILTELAVTIKGDGAVNPQKWSTKPQCQFVNFNEYELPYISAYKATVR